MEHFKTNHISHLLYKKSFNFISCLTFPENELWIPYSLKYESSFILVQYVGAFNGRFTYNTSIFAAIIACDFFCKSYFSVLIFLTWLDLLFLAKKYVTLIEYQYQLLPKSILVCDEKKFTWHNNRVFFWCYILEIFGLVQGIGIIIDYGSVSYISISTSPSLPIITRLLNLQLMTDIQSSHLRADTLSILFHPIPSPSHPSVPVVITLWPSSLIWQKFAWLHWIICK